MGVSVTEMARDPKLSLDDVLARHEVKREDLDFNCPRMIRYRIAGELTGEWNLLGIELDISGSKLKSIHHDNHLRGDEDKAVALLDVWAEEYGEDATCLKLAEALYSRKKRNIIEVLCREVKGCIRTDYNNSGKQL